MDSRLHEKAKALKPKQELKASRYWVGILYPDKKPSDLLEEADFLWIKAHAKITVQTVQEQFLTKVPVDIVLRLGESTPAPATKLADLNFFGDNVVIFKAVEVPSIGVGSRRTPLAPKNTQMTVKPEFNQAPAKSKSPLLTKSETPTDIRSHSSMDIENATLGPQGTIKPVGSVVSSVEQPKGSRFPSLTSIASSGPTGLAYHTAPNGTARNTDYSSVKPEAFYSPAEQQPSRSLSTPFLKDEHMPDHDPEEDEEPEHQIPEELHLQPLLDVVDRPDILESGVAKGVELLEKLKGSFSTHTVDNEAQQWLQQVEKVQAQAVQKRTVVGVVGNTGAGKSSVINAMLDEERLVPTNCMRACTAVVTEMSWNDAGEEENRYRAAIEFIQPADWAKELEILFADMIDANGKVSRECYVADSEASIAYAKIKAVYPKLSRDDLANSTIEKLMEDSVVQSVLGTVRDIKESDPEKFYRRLQHYVDSKEKVTAEKKSKKDEVKQMEFWPLIKVVKIYTKADALSTGAVVVDLPGVHDSNAARAAVAESYMKQCSALWIVAPITRAVDDKAAKSLLGESFKRQLKYDGTYSHVTFICSKTDDISITEAADSLGLNEDFGDFFEKLDNIANERKALKGELREMRESQATYDDANDDLAEEVEKWEKLGREIEEGKTVYAPSAKSKRKRDSESPDGTLKRGKKRKSTGSADDSDLEILDQNNDSDTASDDSPDDQTEQREPLTIEAVEDKIEELRKMKREARRRKTCLRDSIREVNARIKELDDSENKIEAEISARCIAGRNEYSKSAIQQDFAAGIKELDQENAAEEDEENFNPDEELRDYDEVARTLPVYCVSSRAYQKLCGRMVKDQAVAGFTRKEETEIPQLQAHCKKLTESGRTVTCRQFLNALNQLLISVRLWASSNRKASHLSSAHRRAEAEFVLEELAKLEKGLGKDISDCVSDIHAALEDNVYDKYETAIDLAANGAPPTVQKWGAPVDRNDRANGGLYWATYKAICRRDGVFANANGVHDFNLQLAEPMVKYLATGWERAFARRLPSVLQNFVKASSALLKSFHRSIESHAQSNGVGIAGFAMLSQQLRNYEVAFADLASKMIEQMNGLQREANRQFTPSIASAMSSAYNWCTEQYGAGQFMRMKGHMNSHVQAERHRMFQHATEHVKDLLRNMCRGVEEHMNKQSEEVLTAMRRDYLSLLNGAARHRQMHTEAEKQRGQEIMRLIQNADEEFRQIAVEAGLISGDAVEQTEGDVVDSDQTAQTDPVEAADTAPLQSPLHDGMTDDNVEPLQRTSSSLTPLSTEKD